MFFVIFIISISLLPFGTKTLEKDPMDEYNKGLKMMGKQQLDNAIDMFKEIINKYPTFYRAYKMITKAYSAKKDLSTSIQYFKNMKKKDPENAFIYYGLGYAYAKEKHHEEAIKNYKKSIQLNPEFAAAYEEWIFTSLMPRNPGPFR